VLHAEPEFDCANPVAARAALEKADLVVVLSVFRAATRYANVLLPIAPFTETSGTFVNCEGRVQPFLGVAQPLGDTRPGWKVLRVLGTMLKLPGFDFDTSEQVRESALRDAGDWQSRLSNATHVEIGTPARANGHVERVADVPIHFADPLARRAPSLQATADAAAPVVGLPSALWQQVGAKVVVKQGTASVTLPAREEASLAANTVRVPAPLLGAMFGPVVVERAGS
jgi:NADH-quinone oxidoreductase subunit G